MFDNMTPQEAANEIKRMNAWSKPGQYDLGRWIAEACQHFHARGAKEEVARYLDTPDPIDPQADVRQFMEAFGQHMPPTPQWPDQQTMDLRVRLVAEEFCEWLRDSGYEGNLWIARYDHDTAIETEVYDWHYESGIEPGEERSLPKSADALIDLLYVTIGSLLAMGIDMWPLWAEVQRANMAKLGGPVVNGKQMKPEGWQPPAIEELLRKQGWENTDGR